ncbi:hypothetical protein [Caldiplasma sukawensis]
MKILFITVGFQETFQLRSIFRHGNDYLREVIAILPEESSNKVSTPLSSIKKF